jgi:hypothetical protein
MLGYITYQPDLNSTHNACEELVPIPMASADQSADQIYPIIMVDRGNCSFVKKTKNVQRAGGQAAIIVNNFEGPVDDIIMGDDGTGREIFIPSILISKEDGDILKKYLKKSQEIKIDLYFPVPETSGKVSFQIFFNSAHKQIYNLMSNYSELYYDELKDWVDFIPHYISHSISGYPNTEIDEELKKHCLHKGKYCALPREDLNITHGKQILLENIRQKCIYTIAHNSSDPTLEEKKYWQYISLFNKQCIQKHNVTVWCSRNVGKLLGINYDAEVNCLRQNFKTDETTNNLDFDNTWKLLEDGMKAKIAYDIKIYPTILINNKTIYGGQTSENVLAAICSGFSDSSKSPSICNKVNAEAAAEPVEIKKNASNTWGFGMIFLVIILPIILFGIVLYVCRRYISKNTMRRIEDEEINQKINNVVTSYLAMKEVK